MTHSHNAVRVATWNIHSWVGTDGRDAPSRTIAVAGALDADIIALQEVVSPDCGGAACSLGGLAAAHGYHATFGQTLLRGDTRYGNALLSRVPPIRVTRHDLSVDGREHRGAIEAVFEYESSQLRVISTHLGLRFGERNAQFERLKPFLEVQPGEAVVLMGDLNDWFPWSRLASDVKRLFGPRKTPATFPSNWPLFALDRVCVLPPERLRSLEVVRDGEARTASDHLPLVATLALP